MGVKKGQMIVHRAQYGEEAINDIIKFAKLGIPIICLDSVPACHKGRNDRKNKDGNKKICEKTNDMVSKK